MENEVKRQFEKPLGTVAGHFEEPGPRFIDPYAIAEREAIQELEKEEDNARRDRDPEYRNRQMGCVL